MSTRGKFAYAVVDAFASVPFEGNPAAVVVLDPQSLQTFDDDLLQKIAAEFNLSETAFVTPVESLDGVFELRWFTPATEVPLCGHATLATSRVLFDNTKGLTNFDGDVLTYRTMSGDVKARRLVGESRESGSKVRTGQIELEFPVGQTERVTDDTLVERVGKALEKAFEAKDKEVKVINVCIATNAAYKGFALVEVDNSLDLEQSKLANVSAFEELGSDSITAVIVTSTRPSIPNPDSVFISRTFAPLEGIPEDPVCGAAHCILAPYWSEKLGIPKGKVIHARQVSPRGGDVDVVLDQDGGAIRLRGNSVIVKEGEMYL